VTSGQARKPADEGSPGVEGSGSHLGSEWVLGADGLRYRRAARVILLDRSDRVLLLRGHDVDQRERHWWFTIGGGIGVGEDARAAVVRELREETGVRLDPGELVGPVFTRSAIFDFYAEHCRQDEEIFVARTEAVDVVGLSRDGWTDIELDVLDELRWWDLDALDAVTDEVYPLGLARLVRGLLNGWDGKVRHLEEGRH